MAVSPLRILAPLLGCMAVVRQSSAFRKSLSLCVIAALCALNLASLTEDSVFTSFEDAIFEVSCMGNDSGTTEESFLKTELECSCNVDLVPATELIPRSGRPQPLAKPATVFLCLKEVSSEIFTPPEIVS